MDWSTPGFPVPHYLLEFAQIHVPWVSDAIQPSHLLSPLLLPQSFPTSGCFPVSWLFPSGGQSSGASASASVLPLNIQGWFPLGMTGLIVFQSKGLSRAFSSTTIGKHQFFCTQPSWWSNSHMLVGQWIIRIYILTILWLHLYLRFCWDLGIYGLNKDEQKSVLTFKKGPL